MCSPDGRVATSRHLNMACPCTEKNNAAAVAVANAPASTVGVPIVGNGIGAALVQAGEHKFVLWPSEGARCTGPYAQAVIAIGRADAATQQEIDNFEVA